MSRKTFLRRKNVSVWRWLLGFLASGRGTFLINHMPCPSILDGFERNLRAKRLPFEVNALFLHTPAKGAIDTLIILITLFLMHRESNRAHGCVLRWMQQMFFFLLLRFEAIFLSVFIWFSLHSADSSPHKFAASLSGDSDRLKCTLIKIMEMDKAPGGMKVPWTSLELISPNRERSVHLPAKVKWEVLSRS